MMNLGRRVLAVIMALMLLVPALSVAATAEPAQRIELNIDSITIGVGQSVKTVKATVLPADASKTLTWKSADESIATVTSAGKIKGVKKGATTITISTTDGSGVKAELKVTVVKKGKGVKKIALSKKSATVIRGKSLTLKATLNPKKPKNKTVIWKSSDESIAMVSANGKVTGVGKGAATISAISSSGKTATCKVTVEGVKVKKVKLSGKKSMLRNETQQLTAKLTPNDADNQELKWKTSNKKIATVDANGVVTALKKGTVTITATAKDGGKAKGTFKITVKKGVFIPTPTPKPTATPTPVPTSRPTSVPTAKPTLVSTAKPTPTPKPIPTPNPADYSTVELGDGTLEITKYLGSDKEIYIPATLNGKAVTSIGESAFEGCSSLTSVTIPKGITSIGDSAFYGCSLTSVTIPDGVISIGEYAFNDCKNGVDVYAESLGGWCGIAFEGYCASPLSGPSFGGDLYIGGELLTNAAVPDGTIRIGDHVFDGCRNLTSVTIPDGVASIGECAFSGCRSLTSVTIPDGVASIGECAFSGCCSLTSVTIPDSVKSIGAAAFEVCRDLTSVTISKGVTSIESFTFYDCRSLTSVMIPDGVTKIGKSAFKSCSSLTSVTIPESVTWICEEIFDEAFNGCDNLTIYGKVGSAAERYTKKYGVNFVIVPSLVELDMQSAKLDKSTYTTGDIVTISGIKVKNADYVHISGNNLLLTEKNLGTAAFDITVENTGEYKTLDDITMVLSADNAVEGDFYISVQAFNNAGNSSPIDQDTLKYCVAVEEEALVWDVSYDTYYTTITVKVASGTPDDNTEYLFIAEDANGGHHTGTITAGKATASFRIKDLQMPRAAKYDLYVMRSDVTLTDNNRDEYFIEDVVLPLWEGGMINAVRSGGVDVTDTNKLYVGDTIEIDWDGSYGVETTEVVVMLNGTAIEIAPIIDKDGPDTVTIDTSELVVAAGDVLEVSITVTAPDNATEAILEAAGHKSTVIGVWEGAFKVHPAIPTYASITVTNADGSTSVYDKDNPMHLYVGDHNYQKGWKLNVTAEDASSATYKIYSDNPESVFTYRNEAGEVFIEAKKDQDANIYISHIQADSLDEVPEEYRCFVCNVDMPVYRALLIGITDIASTVDDKLRPRAAGDINAMSNMLKQMESTNYTVIKSLETFVNQDSFTKTGISNQINSAFGQATDHDVSLFYFSGHGSCDGSLACPDAIGGSISVNELRAILDNINGKKIVILGSCFSGAHINSLSGDDYIVLTASAVSEVSWAFVSGFDLFESYLAKGSGYDVSVSSNCDVFADIDNNGQISLYECYQYSMSGVLAETQNARKKGITTEDGQLVTLQHVQCSQDNQDFVLWAK